jgi:hypothetical protein
MHANAAQLGVIATSIKHGREFSMKNIAAILIFITFAVAGIGNAIGKEMTNRELALEYLKLSKFEQTINASIDAYSLQLSEHLPEADKEQFKKSMQDVMGWEAIKDQLAELVVKLYTREELKAAIAFEKSRLGASITAKNELFARQFAELLSQNMQRLSKKDPSHFDPENSK